ncbi:MAG: D-2-hydroxyacid dehydrogenase [Terracidiphilus sp.]
MSDQPLILVLAAESDPQLAMLSAIRHVAGATFEDVAGAVDDAEAILHWSGNRETLRKVFLASPKVRWVHSRNAGLDDLLFPELIQSPIPLTNGSGVFSQSLGEFALAAILYFAKDIPRMLRNQRSQRWEQFDVDEVAGQTVGIVGYGDIGRAVATRAKAMGMKVLALKRHAPAQGDPLPAGGDPLIDRFYAPPQILEMLAPCDYVVMAAPLTSETRHMVSDAEFAAMKPSAVVINVGRGPVIDQAALVRALAGKQIRGAGLDVFEYEPIPSGDLIWSLDNVIISPHTADHTSTWLNEAMQFFLEQYERFCKGQPLENVVNKLLGY